MISASMPSTAAVIEVRYSTPSASWIIRQPAKMVAYRALPLSEGSRNVRGKVAECECAEFWMSNECIIAMGC